MKVRIKIFAVLCLATLITTQAQSSGIEFQSLSLNAALEKAKNENKNLFIDVYATWCGPCKYLVKEIFPDPDLGEFMNEHFVSIQLDGEKGDGLMLMEKFRLDAFPTMLLLSPEMELRRKIVGVVSPEEIKKRGNAVVFPESTAIYQLEKKYNSGDRSRTSLASYITESLNEEQDSEELINEFLELYPDLSLENESEFLIFCFGINDRTNQYSIQFLNSAEHYKELYEGLADQKMERILISLLEEALEKKDEEILKIGVEEVYKPYREIFGEYSLEKAALLEALVSNYNSVY